MLKIRLRRIGRKKEALYKIVLIENLSKRDGKALIELGSYNPLKNLVKFDSLLLSKCLNNGAYPTDTVRHIIFKVLSRRKINNSFLKVSSKNINNGSRRAK